MAKTRILLVDDHTLVRSGFRKILEERNDLEVVGEAADGRSAVDLACELKPDLVLMDVRLPDLNGMDATRHILEQVPDTAVVGLSMIVEYEYIVGMLRAGAKGYLVKDCPTGELIEAVGAVRAGRTFICRAAADILAQKFVAEADSGRAPTESMLTSREREIVTLIARGFSAKEIAGLLRLSVHTVHAHRKNVMSKCGLSNNADITRFAIREGLIQS